MTINRPDIVNESGKEVPAQWLQELHRAIKTSYQVLDDLEKAGHPYKRISRVVLGKGEFTVWTGESESQGHVDMNPDLHQARAIAHEVGHGFEERWRRSDSETTGQSMAEAIRFFVEQRMGSSKWTPRADWCIVLDMCNSDFAKFKELLDGEELHRRYFS